MDADESLFMVSRTAHSPYARVNRNGRAVPLLGNSLCRVHSAGQIFKYAVEYHRQSNTDYVCQIPVHHSPAGPIEACRHGKSAERLENRLPPIGCTESYRDSAGDPQHPVAPFR